MGEIENFQEKNQKRLKIFEKWEKMTGKNFKEKYLKQIKLKNKFEGKNFYILKKVVIIFFKKKYIKKQKKRKKRISTRPARSSAGLPRRPAPALGRAPASPRLLVPSRRACHASLSGRMEQRKRRKGSITMKPRDLDVGRKRERRKWNGKGRRRDKVLSVMEFGLGP